MGLDFNRPPLSGEIKHEFDDLLEDAQMAASTDWEENFVEDQLANRKKYGARWQPTDAVVFKLKEIAEWEDEELREPEYRQQSTFFDDDIPF